MYELIQSIAGRNRVNSHDLKLGLLTNYISKGQSIQSENTPHGYFGNK